VGSVVKSVEQNASLQSKPSSPASSSADELAHKTSEEPQQSRVAADRNTANPHERADRVQDLEGKDFTASNQIMHALKRYADAYRHKSVDELMSVWPALSKGERKKIAGSFKDAESVNMDLVPAGDPSISGDMASIRCSRSVQFTFRGAIQNRVADVVTIRLRLVHKGYVNQGIGHFVIDGMNQESSENALKETHK
jgi:hypothetical protein